MQAQHYKLNFSSMLRQPGMLLRGPRRALARQLSRQRRKLRHQGPWCQLSSPRPMGVLILTVCCHLTAALPMESGKGHPGKFQQRGTAQDGQIHEVPFPSQDFEPSLVVCDKNDCITHLFRSLLLHSKHCSHRRYPDRLRPLIVHR